MLAFWMTLSQFVVLIAVIMQFNWLALGRSPTKRRERIFSDTRELSSMGLGGTARDDEYFVTWFIDRSIRRAPFWLAVIVLLEAALMFWFFSGPGDV